MARYKNAALLFSNLVVSRFSGFTRTLLIARFLTPELASIGFLAISIGRGSMAFLETGTRQVVVTRDKCDEDLLASAWWVEFIKGSLIAIILMIAAGINSLWFSGELSGVLFVSAIIPLSMGVISPFVYRWERDQKFGRIVAHTILGTVVGLFLMAYLLWAEQGWIAMPIGIAFGIIVRAVLGHVAAARLLISPFSGQKILALIRDGYPYMGIAFATYLSTLGIDLVLALCGAINWVAPYRVGISLVQVVVGSIAGVVGQASLAADASKNRIKNHVEGIATDFAAISLVIVSVAGSVPLCIYAMPEIALIIFGAAWEPTRAIIPTLTIIVGLRSLSNPMAMVLLAAGASRIESMIKIVEAVVTVLLIGILARSDIVVALQSAAVVAGIGLTARLIATGKLNAYNYQAINIMYLSSIAIMAVAVMLGSNVLELLDGDLVTDVLISGIVAGAFGAGFTCWVFMSIKKSSLIKRG